MMLQSVLKKIQIDSHAISRGLRKNERSTWHRLVRNSGPESSQAGLNEDVLARLKAAEEEAAMLRKELEAAKVRFAN
jgi:alkylated DNA nucleotide flippase Atl1